MDGCYVTPDNSEYTFYTLHLYLNDSTEGKIGGGATTFRTCIAQFPLPSPFSFPFSAAFQVAKIWSRIHTYLF